MYRAILVPTDGSDAATSAETQGLALAERFDARVHLLTVVDLADNYPPSIANDTMIDSLEREGRSHLASIVDQAPEAVETVTAVEEGTPHEQILTYADRNDIDLIVMGTHGRRGLDRLLLGSVTERVTRAADCSVLVTRASKGTTAVDSVKGAIERAREALEDAGYGAVDITEEPYEQRGYWLVRAHADGEPVNVHIDRRGGHARVAEIEPR